MTDFSFDNEAIMDLPEPDPRHCERVKADGSRCRAYKKIGGTLCPAHSGEALENLDPAKAQQASARVRKERNRVRKMTPLQRLEEEAAKHEAEIVARLISYATDPECNGTHQLRAIELIYNRLYGKPEQRIEHTGAALEEASDLDPQILANLLREVDSALQASDAAREAGSEG